MQAEVKAEVKAELQEVVKSGRVRAALVEVEVGEAAVVVVVVCLGGRHEACDAFGLGRRSPARARCAGSLIRTQLSCPVHTPMYGESGKLRSSYRRRAHEERSPLSR